jgi:hypothetical protein
LLLGRRRIPLLLAAALVVVAALAGVAHALESLVDQAMSRSPGTGQIVSQDLGLELKLSRSACGFSLTIDRVYADVNRVVVGYSVSGPAGRRFEDFTADLALTDSQGRELKVTSGLGTGGFGGTSGEYRSFEGNGFIPASGPLDLELTAQSIEGFEQYAGAAPATAPCEKHAAPDARGGPAPWQRVITVPGPFTFHVSVPVDSRKRIAEVKQTLTSSHGTAVTLERTVITPTEARVYLLGPSGSAPADTFRGPPIVATLSVGGKDIEGGWGSIGADGMVVETFDTSLYTSHDPLSIKVLTDPIVVGYSRKYSGEVTFSVTVP